MRRKRNCIPKTLSHTNLTAHNILLPSGLKIFKVIIITATWWPEHKSRNFGDLRENSSLTLSLFERIAEQCAFSANWTILFYIARMNCATNNLLPPGRCVIGQSEAKQTLIMWTNEWLPAQRHATVKLINLLSTSFAAIWCRSIQQIWVAAFKSCFVNAAEHLIY